MDHCKATTFTSLGKMEVDTELLIGRKSEEEQIKILDILFPVVYHIRKWQYNEQDVKIRDILKFLYLDDTFDEIDNIKGTIGCEHGYNKTDCGPILGKIKEHIYDLGIVDLYYCYSNLHTLSEIEELLKVERKVFGIDNLFAISKSFKSNHKENVIITIRKIPEKYINILTCFINIRNLKKLTPIIPMKDAMLLLLGIEQP